MPCKLPVERTATEYAMPNPPLTHAVFCRSASAGGIPKLVSTLITSVTNVKEVASQTLCVLVAEAIWHMADDNEENQTALLKEACVPPLVSILNNPDPQMQTNAAGALACLARNHPENQNAIARAGALAPLCTMVRDAQSPDTREESASALWALAHEHASNKATIVKLGGIEPLVTMLMYGTSEQSSINAAGALATLAAKHAENRQIITKRLVAVLGTKSTPERAVRFLAALVPLCEDEPTNQIAVARGGGIQHLIAWLDNPAEEVQAEAARAMLAVSSNNTTTQTLIAELGGIPPLVMLIKKGTLAAQEYSACALWHLASLAANRKLIKRNGAIPSVVALLPSEGKLAPQVASMLLMRLAEGSTRAAVAIADAGGVALLVRLLSTGTPGTQQMAAATLAALATISRHRNPIADAHAIKPLIQLIWSDTLGTPETAARALSNLARNDMYEDEVSDGESDGEDEIVEPNAKTSTPTASPAGRRESDSAESTTGLADNGSIYCESGSVRRAAIYRADGVPTLVKMLDGSNLKGSGALKSGAIGGWEAVRIGIIGATEAVSIFSGSLVDFGVRIGMQEQAAKALADLAYNDGELQDAIIAAGAVPPLLSLVQCGSALAQEYAARAIWYLCFAGPELTSACFCNQRVVVKSFAIPELIALVKSGSSAAQEMAAAALAQLAQGYFEEHKGNLKKRRASTTPSRKERRNSSALSADDLSLASEELQADTQPDLPGGEKQSEDSDEPNRLLTISDAGGLPPLIKLANVGTDGGKEKAAWALRHLAVDPDCQVAIAANRGINPLVQALAMGNDAAQVHASHALMTLAVNNPENQAQIAKQLVLLLDHDDAGVVSRAARDLQALARNNPGAPVVIVNAGAIMPLVSVLSNGKSELGRTEAAGTLAMLANSGPENQLAIAVGLVGLLGAGTDQAQEYVTELLLDLTSGSDSGSYANRRAIANAGPFKMLVFQLKSESMKVKQLAAAVMAELSGDAEENVLEIAKVGGIPPLVSLLAVEDKRTREHAVLVLMDITRDHPEHAEVVASSGGIPLLVELVSAGHTIEVKARAADALGSVAKVRACEVGEAGAIAPLVELLRSEDIIARQKAAYALTGIATGGERNQDGIRSAGGIAPLVALLSLPDEDATTSDAQATKDSETREDAIWKVKAHSAEALAELAKDSPSNQASIAEAGSIKPLIKLLAADIKHDAPKEQAANALFRLSANCPANQEAIAQADGLTTLVNLVGSTTEKGQRMAADALASLAFDSVINQSKIAELLVGLLRASDSKGHEKAARAISRFAHAHMSNQNAIAAAGGINLVVSLLEPRKAKARERAGFGRTATAEEVPAEAAASAVGVHHLIQKELASALWNLSFNNTTNQERVASCGAIPLLIALLDDHADIHRDAAGALWSLAADATNRKLIADEGGIPELVKLLSTGKKNFAQETAAGALHSLALRVENRDLIADAGEVGGISLLVPLLETGTDLAKSETKGALLTLVIDNPPNQFIIISKLVAMIQLASTDAPPSPDNANTVAKMRLEAQEHATNVIYQLSLNRQYKDAFFRTSLLREEENAIVQLVRLLKNGSDRAQKVSADALSQIARMSTELRIQVTQWLVTLLANPNADVRQRAGRVLQEMNEGKGEDQKVSRDAAGAGGVEKLVELLRDGLKNDRVEAQEYALWSLSVTSDAKRSQAMVREGCIPYLIEALRSGKLSDVGQEHTAIVLACLALDASCHDEIIASGGVQPLVQLLSSPTFGAKKHAALALARLAGGSALSQVRIADEGALTPLVEWLSIVRSPPAAAPGTAEAPAANDELTVEVGGGAEELDSDEPPTTPTKEIGSDEAPTTPVVLKSMHGLAPVAALALSALARDNTELQTRIADAEAIAPLIVMVSDAAEPEGQNAACNALATLAESNHDNQRAVANLGSILPLVKVIRSSHKESWEDAARALKLLATHDDITSDITDAGGIEPLVALLSTYNEATQMHAATALVSLARDNEENQVTLANLHTTVPLSAMLASDAEPTAASAVALFLRLAEHPYSLKTVVECLVEALSDTKTSAQLKATEALAALSARNSVNRTAIVKASAIGPLVRLLGNGTRAENGTPPERAAAVLADLARLAESKVEIAEHDGLAPLVKLLSSSERGKRHSVCALYHLSAAGNNKATLTYLGAIPPLVNLLKHGTIDVQRYAAGTLWQLAAFMENKKTIFQVGGIEALVGILRIEEPELEQSAAHLLTGKTPRSTVGSPTPRTVGSPTPRTVGSPTPRTVGSPTPRKSARSSISHSADKSPWTLAKEMSAAVLAELARSQASYKSAIVKAGGLEPLIEMMMGDSPEGQRQATCCIWGVVCEPKYRRTVAAIEGTIEHLVVLLRDAEGETQGFAAGALVCLASIESGLQQIKASGAVGTLMTIALGPDSWLRGQCVQILRMLGYPDPGAAGSPDRPSNTTLPQFDGKDSAEIDEMLELLGYTDKNRKLANQGHVVLRYQHNPKPMLVEYTNPYASYLPSSPRNVNSPRHLGAPACGPSGVRLASHAGTSAALLARFKAMLAANPAMWMMQEKKNGAVPDDHMADLAAQFRLQDKVIVTPGEAFTWERKAVIAYIGKVPEIAPGFWIGIQFKDKAGKNDGSIGGARYFSCAPDHGGFVRPSRIERDPADVEAEASSAAGGGRRSRRPSRMDFDQPSGAAQAPPAAPAALPPKAGRLPAQQTETIVPEPSAASAPARKGEEGTAAEGAAAGGSRPKPKLRLRDPASNAAKERGRAPTARMGSDAEPQPSNRKPTQEVQSSSRKSTTVESQSSSRKSNRASTVEPRSAATAPTTVIATAPAKKPARTASLLAAVQEEQEPTNVVEAPDADALAAALQEQRASMRQTVEVMDVPTAAKRNARRKRQS